jgi:hypothetical protein
MMKDPNLWKDLTKVMGDMWMNDLPNWISAISTAAAAVVAGISVIAATCSFRKSQAPCVGVYLSITDQNVGSPRRIMVLNIKNFGQQTARNVKLNFSKDFDSTMFVSYKTTASPDKYRFTNTTAYKSSIASIAPGQCLKFPIVDLTDAKVKIDDTNNFLDLEIISSWNGENGKGKFKSSVRFNFEDYFFHASSTDGEISEELREMNDLLRVNSPIKQQTSKTRDRDHIKVAARTASNGSKSAAKGSDHVRRSHSSIQPKSSKELNERKKH